jgi:hypothetical protein
MSGEPSFKINLIILSATIAVQESILRHVMQTKRVTFQMGLLKLLVKRRN